MARIETHITAVECSCGKLHELCYVANQGAVGGGYSFRCGREIRPAFDGDGRRRFIVTLGLEDWLRVQ